jgi:hypothetical protein
MQQYRQHLQHPQLHLLLQPCLRLQQPLTLLQRPLLLLLSKDRWVIQASLGCELCWRVLLCSQNWQSE